MTIRLYQNNVEIFGGVYIPPELRLYQNNVEVFGGIQSAYSHTPIGGLTLSGTININKLGIRHIPTGNLTLDGDSTEVFVGIYSTTVNYIITGPTFREISNNNKYFKLEITNDVSFDDLNIILTSSDLDGTFSEISPITDEIRYVEFFYFPSEVGKHQIDAICTNENIDFVGSKFEFLSTSSNPEEGLYPKIRFKVDFRLENLSLDINIINTKTIKIPDVNGELRHGDEFVLHGEAALYVKKNYVNGVFNCLKMV